MQSLDGPVNKSVKYSEYTYVTNLFVSYKVAQDDCFFYKR